MHIYFPSPFQFVCANHSFLLIGSGAKVKKNKTRCYYYQKEFKFKSRGFPAVFRPCVAIFARLKLPFVAPPCAGARPCAVSPAGCTAMFVFDPCEFSRPSSFLERGKDEWQGGKKSHAAADLFKIATKFGLVPCTGLKAPSPFLGLICFLHSNLKVPSPFGALV